MQRSLSSKFALSYLFKTDHREINNNIIQEESLTPFDVTDHLLQKHEARTAGLSRLSPVWLDIEPCPSDSNTVGLATTRTGVVILTSTELLWTNSCQSFPGTAHASPTRVYYWALRCGIIPVLSCISLSRLLPQARLTPVFCTGTTRCFFGRLRIGMLRFRSSILPQSCQFSSYRMSEFLP